MITFYINQVAAQLNYVEILEELEDFAQRSTVKVIASAQSPWQFIQQLSLNASLVNENSQMKPVAELIYNDQSISLNGNIDVSYIIS